MTHSALELEEMRILKNELEANARKKHGDTDRFQLFNRFVNAKLEKAINLNR
jgi:hypothetical protein